MADQRGNPNQGDDQGRDREDRPRNNNPPPPPERVFGDVYTQAYTTAHEAQGIAAGDYVIPPDLTQLIQTGPGFHGHDYEDPHQHLRNFNYLSNTCKPPGVNTDDIKRILFPLSLRERAATWFSTSGANILPTFAEMATEFITKYFPPSKMEELHSQIHTFKKREDESFKDAWDRYQGLLKKCPPNLIEKGRELQLFYNGLPQADRNLVNASASGGTIVGKPYREVTQLFDVISKNNNIAPVRKGDDHNIVGQGSASSSNVADELKTQMAALTTQFSNFLQAQQQ